MGKVRSDQAHCGRQTERNCDASQGAEEQELEAASGQTACQSEGTLQHTSEQIHGTAANNIGYSTRDDEGAATSQCIDGRRPSTTVSL